MAPSSVAVTVACAEVFSGIPMHLLFLLLLAVAPFARAEPSEEHPIKLTLGEYRFSSGLHGTDLNLRSSTDAGNAWLGLFSAGGDLGHQWRTGWDSSFGDTVRLTPSLQAATGGFFGGSVGLETGTEWVIGVGLGRTNLHPYWNLNFDPNDSYTLSAAYRPATGGTWSVLWVRDNRLNPDQRHLHLNWRNRLANRQRLTADLLYKQGNVDGQAIGRWGASITYDWPAFFFRLAADPKVNFSTDNMVRLSVGTRF